jgi:hypothetical protein
MPSHNRHLAPFYACQDTIATPHSSTGKNMEHRWMTQFAPTVDIEGPETKNLIHLVQQGMARQVILPPKGKQSYVALSSLAV